jgi:predicted ABC-type transport system involved in lysophospholipase L1 biosynthesis ATPase subunit
MPNALRSLFEKPIDRAIEGVIKADDESDLITEVSEYVITKEVAKRLDALLEAYLAGGMANGVWIAGFFGSGKSHLLKILSLLLENRLLGTNSVADLFLPKLKEDPMLKADLERALKIPSRSVRFNIDQKADLISKDQMDALLAVFVKVFNELRGYYSKQGYIAELEAELDSRKLLAPFKEADR